MALSSVHFPFVLANTLHFRHGKTTCGDQEITNPTSPDFYPLGSSPYSKIWIIQWCRSPSPTSTSTIRSKHAGGGASQWLVGWGVFPRALPARRDSVTLVWGKKQQMRLVFLSVWLLCISRAWNFRPICSPGAPALQLCVGRCGTRGKGAGVVCTADMPHCCLYKKLRELYFLFVCR